MISNYFELISFAKMLFLVKNKKKFSKVLRY